jgi:hypothetical protein
MLTRLRQALDGWKTHAAAAGCALVAIACYRLHVLTGPQAYQEITVALFGSACRAAVDKKC